MFATASEPACRGFAKSETHRFHSENSSNSGPTEVFTAVSADNHPPPRRRSSAFFEAGLQGDDAFVDAKVRRNSRPRVVRFRSKVEVVEPEAIDWSHCSTNSVNEMPAYFPTLPRLMFLALIIAIVLPSLNSSPLLKAGFGPIGAKAGPIAVPIEKQHKTLPQRRQVSSTDVCKRWSQQSAVVNGTLYLYGGRSTTSDQQTSDTWSKFISPPMHALLTLHRQRLLDPRSYPLMANFVAVPDRSTSA